jgi:hypothetical protein
MPKFLRNFCLTALLGEVVCILGATACAQQAAAPDQQSPAAAALPASSDALPHRLTHAEAFAAFIEEIGQDDLAARKEAITGEPQPRIDWKTVNHVGIGLTDEDWAIARSILLDGSERMGDWGDEMQEALGWKDGRYQAASTGHARERLARLESLSDRAEPIIENTMEILRQNLGDRAFSRLDAYVYQREGGHRIIQTTPMQRGPIETAKASAQSSSQK